MDWRFWGNGNLKEQYSSELIKAPKEDTLADMLAQKLGGESRVKSSNDPNKREFDTVSDKYIAPIKPPFRKQAKATIKAAIETGKEAYFTFKGYKMIECFGNSKSMLKVRSRDNY